MSHVFIGGMMKRGLVAIFGNASVSLLEKWHSLDGLTPYDRFFRTKAP